MKKIALVILSLTLLVGVIWSPIHALAADTQNASVSIPVNTSLVGDDNAYKDYLLDLPNGVVASSIDTSSLKYSGSNTVSGGISISNGKIKLKLQGVESTKKLTGLQGYRGSYQEPYRTNPSNSIWRYSDGVRWQINEYDETRDALVTHDFLPEDNGVPSARPPRRVISAAPAQDISFVKWYNASKIDVIDAQYIVQSTITPHYIPEGSSTYIKEVKFKNGKVIVNYAIPWFVTNNGTIEEQSYANQDADASHPLTGWAQGRKYEVTAFYYYTADAIVPTYSYSGTITFNYAEPTEPTLIGTAAVIQPNPNPTKFNSEDIAVVLSLDGDLKAYMNSSNIDEWIFYAKEKDKNDTLQTKKDQSKVLTSSKTFDFEIPKERITTDPYRQEYSLTVKVRFRTRVQTPSGLIDSLQQNLSAIVEVYKNQPSIVIPENSPASPSGKPPVAVITAPTLVKAGEEFTISGGSSYDPDGTIKSYNWDAPRTVEPVKDRSTVTWYQTNSLGVNNAALQVVDNDGMTGSTSAFIEVIEPKPVASLKITGTTKQNRKVTLTNNSTSPVHYPLDPTKTKITLTAVSGGTNADIKYSGSLEGVQTKDVLFREPGIYKAAIFVENVEGYSDTATFTINIAPDEAPTVYISMPSIAYRDPNDGNYASVSIDDLSFSPDRDLLVKRKWEYRYDSDNDGSFEDESWIVFSDANEDRLNLRVNEVGKYEVRHLVTEEFGQPTIDAFVTAADRRSADSDSQNTAEKIVEIRNRGPQGDWAW